MLISTQQAWTREAQAAGRAEDRQAWPEACLAWLLAMRHGDPALQQYAFERYDDAYRKAYLPHFTASDFLM